MNTIIIGTAMLALCHLTGLFLGDVLGWSIGARANVGGVGIAMLMLVLIRLYMVKKGILGKKFEEGKLQLDVKEDFFKGEEISEEELFSLMQDFYKEDATFNIVGEKSISLAIELGLISKEGIRRIRDVPFAMALL